MTIGGHTAGRAYNCCYIKGVACRTERHMWSPTQPPARRHLANLIHVATRWVDEGESRASAEAPSHISSEVVPGCGARIKSPDKDYRISAEMHRSN